MSSMSPELAKKYDDTMKILNTFMQRAADGTFVFIMSKDESDNIDREVFYNLLRSTAHTNYLIKQGLINPPDIEG